MRNLVIIAIIMTVTGLAVNYILDNVLGSSNHSVSEKKIQATPPTGVATPARNTTSIDNDSIDAPEVEALLRKMTPVQRERMDKYYPRAKAIEHHLVRDYVESAIKEEWIRKSAIRLIGQIGTEQSIKPLLGLLHRSNGQLEENPDGIQSTASYALGEIATDEVRDLFLRDLLRSENVQKLRNAVSVIGKPQTPEILARMLELLDRFSDEQLRIDIIVALGRSNYPEAFSVVRKILQDKNESLMVKAVAVRALYNINPKESVSVLVPTMSELDDTTHMRMMVSYVQSVLSNGQHTDSHIVNAVVQVRHEIESSLRESFPSDEVAWDYWKAELDRLITSIEVGCVKQVLEHSKGGPIGPGAPQIFYTGPGYRLEEVKHTVNALDALTVMQSREELEQLIQGLPQDNDPLIRRKIDEIRSRH